VHCKLLGNSLKDRRHDFENSINQAQQAALHVLVVVAKHAVEHVEKLDLMLHHRHPPEVELEQQ
jgi:hypothetical protein